MSKQKRNVIICLAAIAVLAAVYMAISTPKASKPVATPLPGGDSQTEDVSSSDDDSVFSLPNFKAVGISVEAEDEKEHFIKEGTNWVMVGKEDIELVQIYLDQLVACAKNLKYNEIVSETYENLEQYGLDNGYKIEITGDDKTVISLVVGDMTVDSAGYYLTKKGDERIYMIGAEDGKALKRKPSDFRDRMPEFVDYNDCKYIKITNGNETYTLEPNPDGAVSKGFGEYAVTGAYSRPMAVETVKLSESIGGPLYDIAAVKFIDNPESDEAYGFDKPSLVIEAEDMKGNKCEIVVGSEATDVTTYARFSGKDYVVTISTENIEKIKNADIFDILIKSIVTTPMSEISRITIDEDRSANKSLKAVFELDKNNNRIELDGKEISSEDFANVYNNLTALTIDGEAVKEAGKIEATVTVEKIDGETLTFVFHDYDTNYYAVEINGVTEFLMGRRILDVFFGSVENLQ
ncbi:MAG: DUF4340 domain-containing protein [Firmicutes bacterium]|nr:DUF4340 domain-containing protein [Bacillota bacterium]